MDAKPKTAEPANDQQATSERTKRGRPALAAWDSIAVWAAAMHARRPDMPRKELAGRLYQRALEKHAASDVPNETTILRRLAGLLDNPEPPMRGNA